MKVAVVLSLLICHLRLFGAKNIVLIVADDLDLSLDGMIPLKYTGSLFESQGAVYTNCVRKIRLDLSEQRLVPRKRAKFACQKETQIAIISLPFVASPICCPNRASILTGRYVHNHMVVNNTINGGCSSVQWQQTHERETFASKIKTYTRYTTFYAGKYLNQYGDKTVGGPAHVPAGWDYWNGLVGNSKYFDYSLSINGTVRRYGRRSEDYLTDVISNMAINFIRTRDSESPFLMVLAPPAPHAPFTPPARHNDKYKGTLAKRTPNFNVLPHKDKHWLVRTGQSPLPKSVVDKIDDVFRRRWEALLAVDDLVGNVYRNLKARNLLNDTYMIFTSDNGYHIGQFSMPLDKRQPYETDIRVPLMIRGPGVVPSVISAPVSSVDIFATVLDIAGTESPSDGTSLLGDDLADDRTLLIEYHGEKSKGAPSSGCPTDIDPDVSLCDRDYACKCEDSANNTYSCIRRVSRDHNNIFCVFKDDKNFVEAYDLTGDASQLTNIGYTMKRSRRHRFRNRLAKFATCKDASCIVAGTRPRLKL